MAGFTQPVYKIVCVKVPEGIFLCETADFTQRSKFHATTSSLVFVGMRYAPHVKSSMIEASDMVWMTSSLNRAINVLFVLREPIPLKVLCPCSNR